MRTLKQFMHNNHAQMGMVGTAVGLLITLIIVVLIFYNISASTYNSIPRGGSDAYKRGIYNMSRNASEATNSQAGTFFTIAPIIAIVIVAVVVIGYVQRIGQ